MVTSLHRKTYQRFLRLVLLDAFLVFRVVLDVLAALRLDDLLERFEARAETLDREEVFERLTFGVLERAVLF